MSTKQAPRLFRTTPYCRTMRAIKSFNVKRISRLFFRKYPNICKWKTNHSLTVKPAVSNQGQSVYVSVSEPFTGSKTSWSLVRVFKNEHGHFTSVEVELYLSLERNICVLTHHSTFEELCCPHYHLESNWTCRDIPGYPNKSVLDWTIVVAHLRSSHLLINEERDSLLIDWAEHFMCAVSIHVRGSPSLRMLQSMRLL